MSSRLKPELQELELETLCEMYGKSTDAKERNDIYRTLYCKLFPMMLSVQKNYPMLSNSQRVEVTMMILISTLRCYNNKQGKKSKFSTYYCTNLKNGMMTQINSLHCSKRCVWLNMVEDEEKSSYILTSQKNKPVEERTEYFMENIVNNTKLSTLEKDYINCVLNGYTKPEEIEKQLNLKHRYNSFNPLCNNKITNPINDKGAINLVKRARKSLKNKIKLLDRNIFS